MIVGMTVACRGVPDCIDVDLSSDDGTTKAFGLFRERHGARLDLELQAHLIDRLLRGYGVKIDTLQTPQYDAYDATTTVDYDPDKSVELLKASGFDSKKIIVFTEDAATERHLVVGGSAAWLGNVFGVEGEITRVPGFFQTDADSSPLGSGVTTLRMRWRTAFARSSFERTFISSSATPEGMPLSSICRTSFACSLFTRPAASRTCPPPRAATFPSSSSVRQASISTPLKPLSTVHR